MRIPLTGTIVLKSTLARFARTLSLSLKSGIPAAQALSVVAEVTDNAWVASRVEQMRNGIERGESVLRTAQTAAVFNPVVLQMIAVGEETGSIDELMQEVADMYEREVDYEIKTLSARIEPLIIVAMGGIVLVLALGRVPADVGPGQARHQVISGFLAVKPVWYSSWNDFCRNTDHGSPSRAAYAETSFQ